MGQKNKHQELDPRFEALVPGQTWGNPIFGPLPFAQAGFLHSTFKWSEPHKPVATISKRKAWGDSIYSFLQARGRDGGDAASGRVLLGAPGRTGAHNETSAIGVLFGCLGRK